MRISTWLKIMARCHACLEAAVDAAVVLGVGAEVVVREEGEGAVSQGTQTGEGNELVQIQASLPEMLQRITSFMTFKRHQVDISNQLEFCLHSSAESTCARTDAAYIKRAPYASHISAYQVHNTSGPVGPLPTPLDRLRRDLHPSSSWAARHHHEVRGSSLVGLGERVSNIERYTNLYDDGVTPRDLMLRVHNLEMRLLELESRSMEYHQPEVTSKSSHKAIKGQKLSASLSAHHPSIASSHPANATPCDCR